MNMYIQHTMWRKEKSSGKWAPIEDRLHFQCICTFCSMKAKLINTIICISVMLENVVKKQKWVTTTTQTGRELMRLTKQTTVKKRDRGRRLFLIVPWYPVSTNQVRYLFYISHAEVNAPSKERPRWKFNLHSWNQHVSHFVFCIAIQATRVVRDICRCHKVLKKSSHRME